MLTDEQLEDLATLHLAPQIDAGEKLDLLPLLRAVEAAERERCSAEFVENGRAIGRAEEREACALACEAEHVGKDVRDPCDNASDEAYNQALEHAATAIRQRVTQAL